MIAGKRLIDAIEKVYPPKISKKYHDYVGLMVNKIPKEVNKILLCLDFDETILPETKEFAPDIIITHHPFIYGKKKAVLKDPHKLKVFNELIKHDITLYSIHTNFDESHGGMNDALARKLELKEIYAPSICPIMRIGTLNKPLDINEFAIYAKNKLNVNYGLLISNGVKMINKVGIVGGAGSGDYWAAKNEGCDIFISGDIPHHIRRDIVINNYNYLDLPHEIEKIFMNTMKEFLYTLDKELDIKIIDHEQLPKVI